MSELVTLEEAQEFLNTTDDVTPAIRRASAEVETIIDNPVIMGDFTDRINGGNQIITLSFYPVIPSSVVVTDTRTGAPVEPDYINSRAGLLERYVRWGAGPRRWRVDYRAGLAETVAEVPADIKKAVLILMQEEQEKDFSVSSESIGDWTYRMSPEGALHRARARLQKYIRRW